MPDTWLPLLSAILWAVSSVVVGRGLNSLRSRKPADILWPLWVSLTTGLVASLIFYTPGLEATLAIGNGWLILSGVLTYFLGTGAYYYTAILFADRADIAAQFSKVKPAITIVLAAIFLPSSMLGQFHASSAALLIMGILLYWWSTRRGEIAAAAIVVGFSTAILWAAGEVTMKIGLQGTNGYMANTLALTAAVATLGLVIAAYLALKKITITFSFTILYPFMLHGLLSFFLAYGFFFEAINRLGVAPTVLATAFWPFLALCLAHIVGIASGIKIKTPLLVWSGSFLFLLASVVQIVAL